MLKAAAVLISISIVYKRHILLAQCACELLLHRFLFTILIAFEKQSRAPMTAVAYRLAKGGFEI